jgi:hypothetical protein
VTTVAEAVVDAVEEEAATQGLTPEGANAAAGDIPAKVSRVRKKVSPIAQISESFRPAQIGGSLTDAHPNQKLSVRSPDITTYRIRTANTETNSKQADTLFNVCHLGR